MADELLASNSTPNLSDELSFERAKALAGANKPEQAIAAFNELINDSNSIYDPRARLELGSILLSQGKTEEAGVKFAEAVSIQNDNSFSEQLQSQIGRCQVEALFGLLECYQQKSATELVESTKKKILGHSSLTDSDRQRLKQMTQ